MLGAAERSMLGVADSSTLGLIDGPTLGPADDSVLGDSVGFSEASADGTVDGAELGPTDSFTLGLVEGAKVTRGLADGDSLGVAVTHVNSWSTFGIVPRLLSIPDVQVKSLYEHPSPTNLTDTAISSESSIPTSLGTRPLQADGPPDAGLPSLPNPRNCWTPRLSEWIQ